MRSPSAARTSRELVDALREALDGVEFPFPAPASLEAESKRTGLAREIDQNIAPALRAAGQPVLIALVGPTGVGKSVLANSLIGAARSATGALRPTTKRPLLLAHPDTIALQGEHPVRAAAEVLTVPQAPPTWAILDCGDPIAIGNDPLQAQPDVPVSAWVTVTSALRYGDSLVWDLLQSLTGRPSPAPEPVALVVGRAPEGAWPVIEEDVRDRLARLDLGRVAVFALPEVAGRPQILQDGPVAPLRRWLEGHFPVPEPPADAPDLRAALAQLAAGAAELAAAQAVHQASVDLLRAATEARLAQAAEAAADFTPGPVGQALAEAWLDQIGPDGPLASIDLAQDGDEDQRRRRTKALAAIGRAVSDAVAPAFRAVMADARTGMVALWQGADVPDGSRALLEQQGLADAALADDLTGSAGYGLWVEGLAARLRKRDHPATRAAAAALGRAGFASLIQAAALGAEGPAGLLGQLLGGDQTAAVQADALEALREARAGAVRLVLAVFADTAAEVDRTASDTLAWAADRLAHAAKKVD
ncbi:MAG: hypothetical protein LBG60_08150 [Bifidobacteriaceae bacterium]|jgi:energy-coupling factor transporter ATP-binding protein EcfA2|nr:hypothetical protein [Bifidobacteriaceae bacterium]